MRYKVEKLTMRVRESDGGVHELVVQASVAIQNSSDLLFKVEEVEPDDLPSVQVVVTPPQQKLTLHVEGEVLRGDPGGPVFTIQHVEDAG